MDAKGMAGDTYSGFSGRPHYRLDAWKRAMQLVKCVYGWSEQLPAHEKYGLVAQIRRAAVSVPSNIAEGAGRNGSKEFAHFLSIAAGSLSELETQYLLTIELGLAAQSSQVEEHLVQTARLISGVARYVKTQR